MKDKRMALRNIRLAAILVVMSLAVTMLVLYIIGLPQAILK